MAIFKKALLLTFLPLTLGQVLARHPYGSNLAYRNAFAKPHVAAYDDLFDIYQRNAEEDTPINLYSRSAEAYEDYENLVLHAARSILARNPRGGSGGFGGFRDGEIYTNTPAQQAPHQWPTTGGNTLGTSPQGEPPYHLRGQQTPSTLQNGQDSGSSSVNTQPFIPPVPQPPTAGSTPGSGSGSGLGQRKGWTSSE
ncbi:hypothetical protein MMC10_009712 [Thelotrema lepadinum]|nr:hypothetical protein [Thelotrema lepadinum]